MTTATTVPARQLSPGTRVTIDGARYSVFRAERRTVVPHFGHPGGEFVRLTLDVAERGPDGTTRYGARTWALLPADRRVRVG